eukprot:CAMPEP_0204491036 /NCGR_PEP_ID=MMETSP0471-20130131/76204_1 /ASSEMBLY_ACC=CAM_ASM_000602 /TAXON_ID=2969 /ORGANISM="Oxyrrhis marina" /LENGTH=243 /DNA_ID=CAMNT_0051495003 /DNA_START=99 /DNA_END=831 /DNA_ORIENTATION=-
MNGVPVIRQHILSSGGDSLLTILQPRGHPGQRFALGLLSTSSAPGIDLAVRVVLVVTEAAAVGVTTHVPLEGMEVVAAQLAPVAMLGCARRHEPGPTAAVLSTVEAQDSTEAVVPVRCIDDLPRLEESLAEDSVAVPPAAGGWAQDVEAEWEAKRNLLWTSRVCWVLLLYSSDPVPLLGFSPSAEAQEPPDTVAVPVPCRDCFPTLEESLTEDAASAPAPSPAAVGWRVCPGCLWYVDTRYMP